MNLETVCDLLGAPCPDRAEALELTSIAYDSRRAGANSLFFATTGRVSDGHDHAAEAVVNGAAAIVAERSCGTSVPEVIVPDARMAMTGIASAFYGHPTHKLTLAGITGTKGKTTTSFMLESIFRTAGKTTGLIGTVETRIAGQVSPGVRTTPEAPELQQAFARMVEAGVTHCVIEATSIGLHQGRLQGTEFDVVAFTNMGRDHLEEYHGTMEDYFLAKKLLFTRGSVKKAKAVINIDDPYGKRIAEQTDLEVIACGTGSGAEVRAERIELHPDGSTFTAAGLNGDPSIRVGMPGRFNVMNALISAGVAVQMGIAPGDVAGGIEGLKGVPGRFETVDAGQSFSVIVDYAHTPESLENVLLAARGLRAGRLICVFGCGGDRDTSKRALMGFAAGEAADLVIATSDNPRSEDPAAILEQIREGLEKTAPPEGYRVIADRREAIAAAVGSAKSGDVVVIAGKGHETGQEINGVVYPFDDRTVARQVIKAS
ncbi:MAG TPA: UDP-N-acetylmuramoyl-L-alanyl-D-glutamate--2,6-diaminopimelate ligase [Actinomycetota bacterium]|nr:UDP-N-acetylmuramoyl-L-alanyl-D-glutamate--2,6-diaminopimelate ligase [Actinomycetota bacterium]